MLQPHAGRATQCIIVGQVCVPSISTYSDYHSCWSIVEHAKKDWRSHKPFCRSLVKASWDRLRFCNPSQGPLQADIQINFDLRSPVHHFGMTSEIGVNNSPPPNTHASLPFLVKMQMSTIYGRGYGDPSIPRCFLLFYDELRTISVNSLREECDPELWVKLDSTLARLGSLDGVKLFVWARRTGEWELSITLDPLPVQNLPW